MMKTLEAIAESFTPKDGCYSFEFGDGYELCLEPLLFDEQWYLALYQNQDLILKEKIVVKLGK